MKEGKEVLSEGVHEVCHNPCAVCNKKGYLDNEEICPVCAGTGCKESTVYQQVVSVANLSLSFCIV